MASFWESIKVDGEDMKLYVCVPNGKGPFPAVVVIQHQGGVDQFVEDMTQRMASAGYIGVAPVLYHRDGPDCTDDGPTRRARLRDVTVIKDVNATVDFLKGHPGVDSERLGIVGFCMGGRVAYLMAAVNPSFKAAAAYYGGNIMGSWGEGPTPFDRSAEMRCPVIGLFGKVHEFHAYPGANHAFMNQHGNRYHAEADRDSWPKVVTFFETYLRKTAVTAG
jgi:carboxymethylenebutenolidase